MVEYPRDPKDRRSMVMHLQRQEEEVRAPTVPPRSKVVKTARRGTLSPELCDPYQSLPSFTTNEDQLVPPPRNKPSNRLDKIAFDETNISDPPPCPHTFPRTKKLKADTGPVVSPPPRKYATVQRKGEAKPNKISVSFVCVLILNSLRTNIV